MNSYLSSYPWTGLSDITYDRLVASAKANDQDPKDRWMDQWNYFSGLAKRKLVLTGMVPDPIIKPALQIKAQGLISDLDAYRAMIPVSENIPQAAAAREYAEFWQTGKNVEEFGRQLMGITQASLITAEQSKASVAQAKASMTTDEINFLKTKAGGDEQYFSQLYNNLYLSKLAEQYGSIIGSAAVSQVKSMIESNQKYLDQYDPHKQAFLEHTVDAIENPLEGIKKLVEKAKDNIPDPQETFKKVLKWVAMIGGTGVILTGIMTGKLFKALKRR
jgi:hypothetical protein